MSKRKIDIELPHPFSAYNDLKGDWDFVDGTERKDKLSIYDMYTFLDLWTPNSYELLYVTYTAPNIFTQEDWIYFWRLRMIDELYEAHETQIDMYKRLWNRPWEEVTWYTRPTPLSHIDNLFHTDPHGTHIRLINFFETYDGLFPEA